MAVLAIDLGGTHATCGVVGEGEVLAKKAVVCEASASLESLLPRFAAELRALAAASGVRVEDCGGLALGFCGLVDSDASRVLSTSRKYEDAPSLDLAAWSRGEFGGLRFRVENDARLALLGEWSAGAGRGFDDVVMITLGTGIGGAAMIGGRLLRGKHHQAGCLGGHIVMNPRGRRCACGGYGCAESEASTWALPLIARDWPGFAESPLAAEPLIDFAALFRNADAADPVSEQILRHCLDVWAALTVGLIHAYDPEIVIFGGRLMRRQERILPAIRKRVEESAWTPWGKVRIALAERGDDAALLGAAPLLRP